MSPLRKEAAMKWKEVASRLTGIRSPIIGLQWNPPEADVSVARRFLVFLEDRRVLFSPWHSEADDFCIQSVLDIRKFLTSELGHLQPAEPLAQHFRAMRAACHRFLTAADDDRHGPHVWLPHGRLSAGFVLALGDLRGVFGVHVAQISSRYRVDIDENLASIIPAADEEESHGA